MRTFVIYVAAWFIASPLYTLLEWYITCVEIYAGEKDILGVVKAWIFSFIELTTKVQTYVPRYRIAHIITYFYSTLVQPNKHQGRVKITVYSLSHLLPQPFVSSSASFFTEKERPISFIYFFSLLLPLLFSCFCTLIKKWLALTRFSRNVKRRKKKEKGKERVKVTLLNPIGFLELIKTVNPAGRWKLVVVDSLSSKILNSACKMYDILEENVKFFIQVLSWTVN